MNVIIHHFRFDRFRFRLSEDCGADTAEKPFDGVATLDIGLGRRREELLLPAPEDDIVMLWFG